MRAVVSMVIRNRRRARAAQQSRSLLGYSLTLPIYRPRSTGRAKARFIRRVGKTVYPTFIRLFIFCLLPSDIRDRASENHVPWKISRCTDNRLIRDTLGERLWPLFSKYIRRTDDTLLISITLSTY